MVVIIELFNIPSSKGEELKIKLLEQEFYIRIYLSSVKSTKTFKEI